MQLVMVCAWSNEGDYSMHSCQFLSWSLLLSLTFSPHNPLLHSLASNVVVISTYSHFQGPGPTSDPFHISLLTSPFSHKLVTIYINISLYLYCLAFFSDLYTLMMKAQWSFKCQKPVTEWGSVTSQKRILIHTAIKWTTMITSPI